MNILVCSVGKHAELIKSIKKELGLGSKVVVTSNIETNAALYYADSHYIVSDVKSESYIHEILEICKLESIDAITTMLDYETLILAKYRKVFEENGVKCLVSSIETVELCFDKLNFSQYCEDNNINTIKTIHIDDLEIKKDSFKFPIFIKPRFGRGSVGALKINDIQEINTIELEDYIVQEYVDAEEYDVDVYVDYFTGEAVSIFAKLKIERGIGGTRKAISVIDSELNCFIKDVVSKFDFKGPINIEVFKDNGIFKIIEINPRFSAAYLHAHKNNVYFSKLINNNINDKTNTYIEPSYEENMMMIQYNTILNVKVSKPL